LIVHLDTSVLIDLFCENARQTGTAIEQALDAGEILGVSSIALYEWLRGPRRPAELHAQEALIPAWTAAPFDVHEARRAALLFQALNRPRRRAADIAIAACAIEQEAALWTLNRQDFEDIPGLMLYVVE
jgi:predicted nucleic acid-binding protein